MLAYLGKGGSGKKRSKVKTRLGREANGHCISRQWCKTKPEKESVGSESRDQYPPKPTDVGSLHKITDFGITQSAPCAVPPDPCYYVLDTH